MSGGRDEVVAGPLSGHFCGQQQPHDAHVWQTPAAYGATTIISTYQCAGLALDAAAVRTGQADGEAGVLAPIRCPECLAPMDPDDTGLDAQTLQEPPC